MRGSAPDKLDFSTLQALSGGKLGTFDVPCPACSPLRRPANRKLRVLRIWHERPDFLTFTCAHCSAHGYAHEQGKRPLNDATINRLIREAQARAETHTQRRRNLARWLWDGAVPIRGTPGERYFRSRGVRCQLPNTLRFRPARGKHPPAVVAAFGVPSEPQPGILDAGNLTVQEIHITRLRPDGLGKIDDDDGPSKIMIGPGQGMPIVLAPVNDIGGLAIAEGIEDAASIHQATGLGAWAAGCANRLPALARAVPQYVTSVTIVVDDDDAGRRYSRELATALRGSRGQRLDIILLEGTASNWRAAA
jgi:hypothetical protein